MAQPYVGEIRMFAGNFAPAGWMFCEGQLLPISENETLFQLIGTTYGGDGESTFALPNLQSRIPLHQGNGLTLAEMAGEEEVTLNANQMPVHNHAFLATSAAGNGTSPTNALLAKPVASIYNSLQPPGLVSMNPAVITPAGGSQPHNNCQPFLCVNFIISLFGIFPSPT
jgi:microcystin-dependent protein